MPYQEPEFLPWDGRRVPITFIGGYLGAGKTTAINALLAQTDRPIAVLVNDVGTINVDAALVKRRHGDTIELTDGCICCTSIEGFGAAFDALRARADPPDHVVVELSGVADPARVVPWGNTAGFVLDGVVVVAAADQLLDAGEAVRAAIRSQLVEADLVVLTKTDLLDADRVAAARHRLTELAPGVAVIESAAGSPAMASLLALGGRRPGGVDAVPAPTLFDAHDVRSVALPVDLRSDQVRQAVDAALARCGPGVVRAKGVVAPSDGPALLVQVVGARCEITPLPEAEAQPATPLTVISLRS